MGGWNGAGEFSRKMGGKGQQVPCMYKLAGIEGCPHCAKAAKLFEAKKDDEGRKAYFKKAFYGYAKIIAPPASAPEKAGKICLVNFPQRPVENIMKRVQHTDEDLRWPVPTDLETGGIIILSKTKGDGDFPNYAADYVNTPQPIPADKWETIGKRLCNVTDALALTQKVFTLDKTFMFSPREDMKEGETVRLRLLPVPGDENTVPFGMIFTHYVAAPTPWDKAWEEVKWNPERLKEVIGMLGESCPSDGDAGGDEDMGW